MEARAAKGGTFGGSSGSPVMIQGGYVVGQLLGACGSNPEDGCDTSSNAEINGAFSQTYSSIKSFIDPAVSTAPACRTPTRSASTTRPATSGS